MTQNDYETLVRHLKEIAPLIPIRWGRIQNDSTDAKINMFAYDSFEDLNRALAGKPADTKTLTRAGILNSSEIQIGVLN